jgi:hypothetical protein
VTVLEAGQTVDRYEVREFVGEGGMAMVYRAGTASSDPITRSR